MQLSSLLNKTLLFLSTGLLLSCGYHSTRIASSEGGPIAVSIPLIASDEDGFLREELARNLAASNKFTYRSSGKSRYKLIVQIKGDRSENVGYTWDQNPKTGELLNRLYPSEGRRMVSAAVTLKDTDTDKNLCGPFTVSTFVDYDYVNPTAQKNIEFTDLNQQQQSVLQYSLGQLDSEEGAKNESFQPLFQDLAQKIVNALLRSA